MVRAVFWVVLLAHVSSGAWVKAANCFAEEAVTSVVGTVWLDQNMDGIREPNEPVLANQGVAFGAGVAGARFGVYYYATTDDQGHYEIRLPPNVSFSAIVRIPQTEPGSPDSPTSLSEYWEGLTGVTLTTGAGVRRLDIRVRRRYEIDPARRLPRLTPDDPGEWPLRHGRFFKAVDGPAVFDLGYSVVDLPSAAIWTAWSANGASSLGYPISDRWTDDNGLVAQLFEKALLIARADNLPDVADLLDRLHDLGHDAVLHDRWLVPHPVDPAREAGLTAEQVRARRLALLDMDPALRARYFAAEDTAARFGLPTSAVEDFGDLTAIRTQKAVLQHWKVDTAWAKAGEVVVANAGVMAKELGLFPAEALIPQPPTSTIGIDDP